MSSDCRSETLSRYFAWSACIARVYSCSSHPCIVHRTRGTMNQPLVTSVETQLHSFNSYFKSKKKNHSNWVVFFLAPQTGLEPVTPRLTAACSTDWAIKAKYCTTLVLPKVVLCRHRLIFPGRFQPSIVSTDELNYRVRDGNGWTLIAKNTD